MTALSPVSPHIFVVPIEDQSRIKLLGEAVTGWTEESDLRIQQLESPNKNYGSSNFGPPLKAEMLHLVNYSNVAFLTGSYLEKPRGENYSFVAAYDTSAKLQGVAILLFRKSKKGTPFVQVCSVATAFWNMPLNGPTNPSRIRGIGNALIAYAAVIDKNSKIVYAVPTDMSLPFYKKIGFVPTRKEQDAYKFLKKDFEAFIRKQWMTICKESDLWAQKSTSYLSVKLKEGDEKKDDKDVSKIS